MKSLTKKIIFWYFHFIKDLFELVFGIKIFKIFYYVVNQIIRFIKFSFISFHLVIIVYYFMYPQHVYKQLLFHKNEFNNYFSYFLENSTTQQLFYQWRQYKSALIEQEEALNILESRVKKEEKQLEIYVQQSLKQVNAENEQAQTENNLAQNNRKENDDITLNILNHQNIINKYKSEYDEYKSKLQGYSQQKKKEMMWQNWIEMDLICNLHANQNTADFQPSKKYTETSSILLELQILNLSQYPLKVIPLNIVLIDKFNQKIPLKKDIIIQQDQQARKSYWEKVLSAILQKCFHILGIDIEEDIFEIRQQIDAFKKESGPRSNISGILISLENPNNQYLIQQARIEIIPSLQGLKYLIFHYFYATFVGLFTVIIIYLYVITGLMKCCCNLRGKKNKKE
ncbi:hypothetical protein ABPG72_019738 [Tetrahymena utriculariae]